MNSKAKSETKNEKRREIENEKRKQKDPLTRRQVGGFLDGFWWIFGTKMKPSWHQNGIKNGVVRKNEKTYFGASLLVPN